MMNLVKLIVYFLNYFFFLNKLSCNCFETIFVIAFGEAQKSILSILRNTPSHYKLF